MSTLKDKIEYLNKGFKNGNRALDNQNSLLFLNDILEEMSADAENLNEFKENIPTIYKACMEELRISPQETKTILLNNVLKNVGIDSSIKDDLTTKAPIFQDFLMEKSPDMIYSEINELFGHAFDEKYKRIEVDALISTVDAALSKNPTNEILSTYINHSSFDRDKLSNVMAATIVLKEFSENGTYNLTENQNDVLNNVLVTINNTKNQDKDFAKQIDSDIEVYNKFMFFNTLNVEAQLHEMKETPEFDASNGFISSHPIEEPLQETLNAKKKRDSEIDVTTIEWEQKYKDYLNSLMSSTSSVKVMSSTNKFKAKFASHGFAPATASLFGDSIVVTDKFGDPQKTLWNVSALTGTMRLSRDVDYSDPRITEQTFAIAALNARRNNWPTVYLNHPGPDNEAKHFMESSITAMVEIGNYNFDDIKVPRKYQHVLDFMKNNYAVIENGVNHENNNDVVQNVVKEESKEVVIEPANKTVKEEVLVQDKTDINEFDADNEIFNNNDFDISIDSPPSHVTETIDDDFDNFDNPDLGDLNLDDSTKDILKERDRLDNNDSEGPKPAQRVRLFKQ